MARNRACASKSLESTKSWVETLAELHPLASPRNWRAENGKRQKATCKQTANSKQQTANSKQQTAKRKLQIHQGSKEDAEMKTSQSLCSLCLCGEYITALASAGSKAGALGYYGLGLRPVCGATRFLPPRTSATI